MCNPCLLSTDDIGTPIAQCLFVNKNSHQWQQGCSVFYRGWLVWNPLLFAQGIASPDYEACQIRWMYYGTFQEPTLPSPLNHFYLVYKPMICFIAFFWIFNAFWVPYSIAILKFGADNGFIGLFLDWLGVDF